jgi:F-type H+-transporting ATPase subunit a
MAHELWITGIFNHYLAGAANALLNAVQAPAKDLANPWTDWMVCEVLVVLGMLVFFGIMKSRYSVENPGKTQHVLEVVYEFFRAQTEESVGDHGLKYLPFFGTIFLFVLCLNLFGVIPGFDSPTMYPMVPFGLAVVTFFFYHFTGIREHGPAYIKHFMGPIWGLVILMFPIEIVSNLARPLSLTVRLFANMFAGEQVYLTFLSLTKLIIPVVFIGLHVFVSFLQAYIFMALAMVYVGGAVAHEH